MGLFTTIYPNRRHLSRWANCEAEYGRGRSHQTEPSSRAPDAGGTAGQEPLVAMLILPVMAQSFHSDSKRFSNPKMYIVIIETERQVGLGWLDPSIHHRLYNGRLSAPRKTHHTERERRPAILTDASATVSSSHPSNPLPP